MTRQTFLDALRERLRDLPEAELTRQLEHFAELIDDRVEMGMPEADAVAALGDPDRLIEEAMLPMAAAAEASDCADAIREIHIHTKNADASLRPGHLPEGVTARIDASERDAFTWSLVDGVLTVAEAGEVRRGLFKAQRGVTLTLDGCSPEKLIADTYGGDLKVENVQIGDLAVLSASTGDIVISRFNCGGRAEITCRSGDIELNDLHITGDCKLENLSGDIELRRVEAGALRARTAGGDIDGEGILANTVALGATSGDVEINSLRADTSLLCETAAGDIDLNYAQAPDLRLSTGAGDVTLRLPYGAYDIQAETRSGDVVLPRDIPTGESPARVRIHTQMGDVRVRIEERS